MTVLTSQGDGTQRVLLRRTEGRSHVTDTYQKPVCLQDVRKNRQPQITAGNLNSRYRPGTDLEVHPDRSLEDTGHIFMTEVIDGRP